MTFVKVSRLALALSVLATQASRAQPHAGPPAPSPYIRKISDPFIFVGGGSGVIISADGYALSNFHVVSIIPGEGDRGRFMVRRAGGDLLEARVVGLDPEGDLALLKIRSAKPLPFAPIRPSATVKGGEPCHAVGNPFALGGQPAEPSISSGIVCGVGVGMDVMYSETILTDAAINPGNSGGPLYDAEGNLIGINGRIATRFQTRFNTGAGYAIASDYVSRLLPQLMACQGGYVRHADLPAGLVMRPFGGRPRGGGAVAGSAGMSIQRVQPGSDAEKAGFRSGDRILAIGGETLSAPARFVAAVQQAPVGLPLQVTVGRGEPQEEIGLSVTTVPKWSMNWVFPMPPVGPRDLGATFEPEGKGMRVASVLPMGPAWRGGLKAGDRVTGLRAGANRAVPLDVKELNKGFQPANPREAGAVRFEIARGADETEETLTLDVMPGDPGIALTFHASPGFSVKPAEGGGLRVDDLFPAAAAPAAFAKGDLILAAGGKPVASHWDLLEAFQKAKTGETVTLSVKRASGATETVSLFLNHY